MSLPGNRTGDRTAPSPLQRTLTALLRTYKWGISPMLRSACRFHPTCSEYMHDAILRHGSVRGLWLGLKRLGKCHPFHAGGVDLVPENETASKTE